MTKRDMLLQALSTTVPDLERLGRGFDNQMAAWQPPDQARSAVQVLLHLVAVELAYHSRIATVLAKDRPTISSIPTTQDAPQELLHIIMAKFAAERVKTIRMLGSISPGAWQRVAVHELKGPMTLRFLIQDLVAHDIEQTNQLVEIQAAHRKAGLALAPLTLVEGGQ